jgi:hypothetical protein
MENCHGHRIEVHEVSVARLAKNWWAVALRSVTSGNAHPLSLPAYGTLLHCRGATITPFRGGSAGQSP